MTSQPLPAFERGFSGNNARKSSKVFILLMAALLPLFFANNKLFVPAK